MGRKIVFTGKRSIRSGNEYPTIQNWMIISTLALIFLFAVALIAIVFRLVFGW